MTTFVALLRGINVSGQKSIRMVDLRNSFTALGFANVRSYLQSGNLVFDASRAEPRKLASAIKARIADDFGHEVEVFVLTAKQLDLVASSNPLPPRRGADEKIFHGTFLFQPVSKAFFQKLKLPVQAGEQAVLIGQVVLLHCPHGYGRTKLNNVFFEKALKLSATTRNWRTILALQALCTQR